MSYFTVPYKIIFHAFIVNFLNLIDMKSTKWQLIFTALYLIKLTSSKYAKLKH